MTSTREFARERGLAGRITFGATVRARRKKLGLSQEELAEKAGVDRQSVNRAENATVGTSIDRVYQLARALGCEASDLLPEPGRAEQSLAAHRSRT